MVKELIIDALRAVLQDHCAAAHVRAIEAEVATGQPNGPAVRALLGAMESSGLFDALRPEDQGGAGLPLAEAFELLELCGAFAQPLPLAETLLTRAGLDGGDAVVVACADAALMSGAMQSVLQMTLQFANQRTQFGRPIARFQAVQHQLAVMAEHALAAQMAARIACTGPQPDLLRVAVAKARCAEAAVEVAAIAHAMHGAIGFTAELDLQLFTRRLHHWRQRSGTESHWHAVLGQACLDSSAACSLDFVRSLSP